MLHEYRSFIVHLKPQKLYADLVGSINIRVDTANYEKKRSLSIRKNKKKIGLMKDELCEKMMRKFAALRPKIYSYPTDDGYVDKKVKDKKSVLLDIKKIPRTINSAWRKIKQY